MTVPRLLLSLAVLGLVGCPRVPDADGDGHGVDVDCDDSDPNRYPGRAESCDGRDNDCDASTWAEGEDLDYDADGSPSCADCDDQNPGVHPGASPFCVSIDADCDGEPDGLGAEAGSSSSCPAVDCAALLAERPGAPDGSYWIDAGGAGEAFEVACDMGGADGGWIRLQLDDDDGVIVASRNEDNPWHKCEDDAASSYEALVDEEMSADWIGGGVFEAELRFRNPETGDLLAREATDALRAHVSELHPETRMLATVGDNDGYTWEDGSNQGLEVFLVGAAGDWTLLTPGSGGDCGAGPGSWPSAGGETGFFFWSTDPSLSEAFGDTGGIEADWALAAVEILPVAVELVVFTGGGVSFGWEQRTLRVR